MLNHVERFCVLWTAFGEPRMFRKHSRRGSSSQSTYRPMWQPLPTVHCSEEAMTLKASGREYTNIFVERGENSNCYSCSSSV